MMFRLIASATLLLVWSNVTYAQNRDPAMGAAAYVGKKAVEKAAGKALGVDGKIGTNNKIENPGSKEHKEHIQDLKAKGQYNNNNNNNKGAVISK